MGKLLTCSPRLTLAHCGRRSGQLQVVRAAETFNVSHRPDGRIADALASTHACTTGNAMVNYSGCVQQRPFGKVVQKAPMAPMGRLLTRLPRLTLAQLRTLWSTAVGTCCRDLAMFPSPRWETHGFAHCLQGGGVNVGGGTVTLSSCTITGNTAYVRAHAQIPHRPDGGKIPHAPMGKWLTCLPRLTLAQLRTLRSTTGGACSKDLEKLCKRFPSPPGRLTFACCLQGGGVYVYSGTVTITSSSIYGNTATFVVRAHAQNFPSSRGETQLTFCSLFAGRRCLRPGMG